MQALSETWREKLFDEQIEHLKAKRKENERKSLESKLAQYRSACSFMLDTFHWECCSTSLIPGMLIIRHASLDLADTRLFIWLAHKVLH